MRSDICAICKKPIEDYDMLVVVGLGIPLPQYSLCSKCGSPIASYLEANGLSNFTKANAISWNAGSPKDQAADGSLRHQAYSGGPDRDVRH
jgi:hypothetical protein